MNVSPKIANFIGDLALKGQKHSPTILTAVGVVGVVAAGILAARATLKLEDTLDDANRRLERANDTDESKVKAVAVNTVSLVKLYGPSVTLGLVSLVCIVSANNILSKRNAGLALAYKGLEETVNKFRERVRGEVGEEKERDLWLGLETKEYTDEKGKKKTVKVLEKTVDGSYGATTFIFDDSNPNWQGNQDFNMHFLGTQESILNDLLHYRGHVFVNEVLDKLGMKRTPEGQVMGWKKFNTDGSRNYVDFNLLRLDETPMALEGEHYGTGTYLIDLKVGYIWDEI